jgi:hypothetical protein
VLQIAAQDESSLHQLSTLISTDHAFSSEILTIANSPLYPVRVPVTNILHGIATLGLERIKGLAVTVGVRAYLGRALKNSSLQAIWRHSLTCALLAEQCAEANMVGKATAYTAGIMHEHRQGGAGSDPAPNNMQASCRVSKKSPSKSYSESKICSDSTIARQGNNWPPIGSCQSSSSVSFRNTISLRNSVLPSTCLLRFASVAG